MSSDKSLVPASPNEMNLSPKDLCERLIWVDEGVEITISSSNSSTATTLYPWPAVYYKDYTECLRDAKVHDLEIFRQAALRQLSHPDSLNVPVARLLGRSGYEVVELQEGVEPSMYSDFMVRLPSVVDGALGRVKASLLPHQPLLFTDFHRGLDQVMEILAGASNDFSIKSTTSVSWLQRAQNVIEEQNQDTPRLNKIDKGTKSKDAREQKIEGSNLDILDQKIPPKNQNEHHSKANTSDKTSKKEVTMLLTEEDQAQKEAVISAGGADIKCLTYPSEAEAEDGRESSMEEKVHIDPKAAKDTTFGTRSEQPQAQEDAEKPPTSGNMLQQPRPNNSEQQLKEVESKQQSLRKVDSKATCTQSIPETTTLQPSSPTTVSLCDSSGAASSVLACTEPAVELDDPGIEPRDSWPTVVGRLEYVGWSRVRTGEFFPPNGIEVRERKTFDEQSLKALVRDLYGWKGKESQRGKRGAQKITYVPSSSKKPFGRTTKRPKLTPTKTVGSGRNGRQVTPGPSRRRKEADEFFEFSNLIKVLQKLGWVYKRALNELQNFSYILPGRSEKTGKYRVDYFHYEYEVIEYVKKNFKKAELLKQLSNLENSKDTEGDATSPMSVSHQQGTRGCVTPAPTGIYIGEV